MLNQVWGKVFETALLKEKAISFPDLFWGEDRLFFFRVLEEAKAVAVTDACFYDYIQQENSLISRFLPDKCATCEEIHRSILSLAEKKEGASPAGEGVYSYMYVKSLLSAFATLFSPRCPLKRKEKILYIRKALAQESLQRLAPFPPDAGLSFRIPAFPVRRGWAWGTYLVSRGIHTVSALAPSVFRRAKHAYNQNKGEKE
jgi:hypothetical protein